MIRELIVILRPEVGIRVTKVDVASVVGADVTPLADFLSMEDINIRPLFGISEEKLKQECCKFPFALSRQDVEKGAIRWEFGRPYLIAHGDDGYCIHLDRESYRCTVWEQRPVPCRGLTVVVLRDGRIVRR